MAKKDLPQNQGRQTTVQVATWDYPYPPAHIWNQYPPEMQKVIVEAWQSEMNHRRQKEMLETQANIDFAKAQGGELWASSFERRVIVVVAALIFLSLIGLGIFLITKGKSLEGFLTLIATFGIIFNRYWTTKNGKN